MPETFHSWLAEQLSSVWVGFDDGRADLARKVLETMETQRNFYEAQRQCDADDNNHEFAHYYTVARNIASEVTAALRELFEKEGVDVTN